MKTTHTLESAITRVHNASANHYDDVVPVQDMRFHDLERLDIAGQSFGVLPSAQRLLANRLRIPFSYLARCPEDLQQANLNYWLERESLTRQSLFCRFDGQALRAVFTERYTAIDHMEVLTKMLEYGFDPAGEVHFSLDQEIMVMKVPEYDRQFLVSEKDKIVPGISIANSEVGILALSIEAFYFRLICTNGLIAKTAINSRYKHISRRVLDEFPDVLRGVVHQSRHGQDRFLISTQTPVDNPERTIETFCRQFQIPLEQAEIVKQAFYLEPGATMWSIINAMTYAAKDRSLSASDAYRLERAGGHLLGMVRS
ncbi:MAG: DUF932 domain-containing protein [Pseudomonadota bacterium]